jgi:hypothetical protein
LSAPRKKNAALLFACERSGGVLVVFELDHGLTLLEAFKIMHKGNFVSSTALVSSNVHNVNGIGVVCGSAACAVRFTPG